MSSFFTEDIHQEIRASVDHKRLICKIRRTIYQPINRYYLGHIVKRLNSFPKRKQ